MGGFEKSKLSDFSFDVVMRLAKIKNGRIWLNPKLKGEKKRRVQRHMKVFKELRKEGVSRSKAICEARKAEHRGMTKRQVRRYEGELGALARYGRRKNYK